MHQVPLLVLEKSLHEKDFTLPWPHADMLLYQVQANHLTNQTIIAILTRSYVEEKMDHVHEPLQPLFLLNTPH